MRLCHTVPATYKSNQQLRSPFQHLFFVVWSDLHGSNSWGSSKWRILFFQRSNSFRPTERFFLNSFMRNRLFYRCYNRRCVGEQFVNVDRLLFNRCFHRRCGEEQFVNVDRLIYSCFHRRCVGEQFVNVNTRFPNSWFPNSWERII